MSERTDQPQSHGGQGTGPPPFDLFLASIGLALVLRQALLLVAGPEPRFYDVNPYKVFVLGNVRDYDRARAYTAELRRTARPFER